MGTGLLGKGLGSTTAAHMSLRKLGTRNEVRPSGPRLNEGFSAASASSCFAGMSRHLSHEVRSAFQALGPPKVKQTGGGCDRGPEPAGFFAKAVLLVTNYKSDA